MGKVSALPQENSPTGTDYFYVVDTESVQSKKVLLSELTDAVLLSNPYKFRANRQAAANTGNGAFAVLATDVEQFDTGGNLTAGVFTAPIAGFYQFNASVSVASGGGDITLAIFKNGAEYSRGAQAQSTTTGANVSDIIQLAAGDTVDIRVYAATTKALNVTVTTAQNYFSGFLVSAT